MTVELRVPPLGESVTEGVVARWLKRDGEVVRLDEPVIELETDKASIELAAPATGRLEIVAREGVSVRVGTVVARIDETVAAPRTDGRAPAPAAAGAPPTRQAAPAPPAGAPPSPRTAPPAPARAPRTAAGPPPAPAAATPATAAPVASTPARAERPSAPAQADEPDRLAPSVRRLVEEHGLDVGAIEGTGPGGRPTKADVLHHLQAAERADRQEAGAAPESPPESPPLVERVPMTPLRRRIAERLVRAQQTAAILTTFNEVDCRALLDLRARHRERFKAVHGVDLGLMSLFGRAVVLALAEVPILNARIDEADIVYHRHVNLGIAVSTPRGLVVPVVRHAHAMSLAELERAIGELARRARDGRLAPDDLAGGTFSITNGGVFGSMLSTPILNPPQSGILGMHKIQDRPVAVGGEVVIRPVMFVALSYDHRLVDGEQAVTFLVRVKEKLEDPVRMLLEV